MWLIKVIFSIYLCTLFCGCQSEGDREVVMADERSVEVKIDGRQLNDAWKDVGFIGRYKKYCPDLRLRVVFADDYNSLVVLYEEKAQKFWIIGTIDEYKIFSINGINKIKSERGFSELIFYHDGEQFKTAVLSAANWEQFKDVTYETWAYGWSLKDTDELFIEGLMSYPSANKVSFELRYSPSKGWIYTSSPPVIEQLDADVFLFSKEPVYGQMVEAFKNKNELNVMLEEPPSGARRVKLKKATALVTNSKSELEYNRVYNIDVGAESIVFDKKNITEVDSLRHMINELALMCRLSKEPDLIIIAISQSSNDLLLKELIRSVSDIGAELVILVK